MAGGTSSYASAIQTSPDGTNWVIRTSAPTTTSFKGLAYASDTFVGVGNYGNILQAGALVVTGPEIEYVYATNTLTLKWDGGGALQAAPVVTGPYTNVPGAMSPYDVTPLNEPSLFFRVVLQP